MSIPLHLIRDSTSGLLSPARDVGDVSCRWAGIWERKKSCCVRPWNRALFENLIVCQLLRECYETRRRITAFGTVLLSLLNWDSSSIPHPLPCFFRALSLLVSVPMSSNVLSEAVPLYILKLTSHLVCFCQCLVISTLAEEKNSPTEDTMNEQISHSPFRANNSLITIQTNKRTQFY